MIQTPTLRGFQRDFAKHLRSPGEVRRPNGVPKRAAEIYSELLFNNLCGFINACFPVARSMMTEQAWRTLSRQFFRDHSSHTPYFSQIPEQFVLFVANQVQRLRVPAWMPDLLHYEWVELEVDTALGELEVNASRMLTLNPSVRNLRYEWPVHKISPDFRPKAQQATFLLVYRNREFKVCFLEINEVTAALLHILAESPKTTADVLAQLAKQLGYASPDPLQIHGRQLLADFISQDIITGKLA
jgi:uncharacterized protein